MPHMQKVVLSTMVTSTDCLYPFPSPIPEELVGPADVSHMWTRSQLGKQRALYVQKEHTVLVVFILLSGSAGKTFLFWLHSLTQADLFIGT